MPKRRPGPRIGEMTTLLHLVRLGAGASFASISTKALGESLELSQQASSLRLIELERTGLVERAHSGRGLAVRLTQRGLAAVETFLSEASSGLKRAKSELDFRGTVFTGLNEGRYYISLKGYSHAFSKALGFVPFPGTLNLRLAGESMVEERRRLNALEGVEVQGFSDGKRSYGPVKCFRATIEGKQEGAVLAIERTHYDSSVLEVIAPVDLRRSLGLKDGAECRVTAHLT